HGARRPRDRAAGARAPSRVRLRAGRGPRRRHGAVRGERSGRGGGAGVPGRDDRAGTGARGPGAGAGRAPRRARGVVRAAPARGRVGARGGTARGGGVSGAVVAVRLRALGDVTLCTAALHSLAEGYPGRELHVVTESRFAPLLEGQPGIARVLRVERTTRSTFQVLRALRALRPAVAVDFFGNTRSALLAR